MEKLIFKGVIVLIISFLLLAVQARGAQVQKTFTWKYPVNMETHISFENYNCDLVVHTWEKSETEFHLTIEATGKKEDDETRLIKYLENFSFSHSGAEVKFRTTFWKNRKTINGNTTLEMEGVKDISFTEFNMKGEVWIPAGNSFALDSKYSRIDMENFNGKLELNLYNDNFYGANIMNDADINAKYANIEFKEMKTINAELYSCDFDAVNTGDVTTDSKYSKFTAKSARNITIDSYNDKFNFESTGDVRFSAKYSDLKTSVSGKATLDCYNGTISIGSSKAINLTSKYAEFRLDNTGDIKIRDSYNDKFIIGTVTSVSIDVSKYSIYRINELTGSLSGPDSYNDQLVLTRISSGFKEIRVTGKYCEINVGTPASLSFRLKTDIKYPTLEINESAFTTKTRIEQDSNLQYEGVKGAEKADMPLVEIKGYNMTLKID